MERQGSLIPRRCDHDDESGFTLLELVLAVAILLIIMGAVAMALTSTLNVSRNNANRSVAANIASQKIDELRQLAAARFSDFPLANVTTPVTVDGVRYSLLTEATWIPKGADTNPCDSESTNPIAYVRVNAKVTWPQMNGIKPVEANTIITPPVKTFGTGKGNVGIKVTGAANQPIQGVTVTMQAPSGTPTYSKQTSSAGCAFFAFVDPLPSSQAYTVTLNEPGYVNPEGQQIISEAATVIAGETADPIGFRYDRAATLNLTLKGLTGGPDPVTVPDNVPVSLGNSGLFTGNRSFAGAPGTSRSITGLFPFEGGYSVWAGDCADSDPQGEQPDGTKYFAGGLRDLTIPVTPAGTTTGDVWMQSIEFTVYEDSVGGPPQAGETIVATHSTAIGECPAATSFTLGTTDTNGVLRAALPYGHYVISVQGEDPALPSGSPTWPGLNATPPAESVLPSFPVVIQ